MINQAKGNKVSVAKINQAKENEVPVKREMQIPQQSNRAHVEAEKLEAAIDTLLSALQPVLREEPPGKNEENLKTVEPMVAVARQFYDIWTMIQSQTDRIKDALDRLEL